MIFDGCLDYVCLLHTDATDIEIRLPVTLLLSAMEDGTPFIDVVIAAISHNISSALDGRIHLTGCAIGEINEFLNDNLGFNAFDLVVDQLVGEIDSQIAEQIAPLEETIEEALLNLWQSDSIDLLDTQLTYDLHPTVVEHNDHGLRLALGGALDAEPADCIKQFEDAGSLFTASDLPAMSDVTPETGVGYHLGALLSDDLVNQGLYAAWRGGVLCFVASDLGSIQLTTTYLGLLLGVDSSERIAELLGEGESPLLIRTVPEMPPVLDLDGPNDLDINITGLNVEFYPIIQGRFSRLASVAIDISAGINIFIDETDALGLEIILDTDNLNPRVTYNEIAPDLNEAFENNFPGFLTTIIDTVAGSLLGGMAFALPTFGDTGLADLYMELTGAEPTLLDFLGAYAILGPSTGGVSSGGCDSCGDTEGCADCGGEGGCAGDLGCGDLTDPEACNLEDSGCSGTGTDNPDDVGCQGCRFIAKQNAQGRWVLTMDSEGVHSHRQGRRGRIPLGSVLGLLGPVIFLARRRRTAAEQQFIR